MESSIDNRLKEYLKKAIVNGTLNQSYIFEGTDKEGQIELARFVSKSLLCTADISKRPCGACHACILLDNDNHPDCRIIRHEKPNLISVDEIREQVVRDVGIRPFYGGRKIYIIPDAGLMKKEGQNALLKTIEEPPLYVLIILIVTNRELLLETIRSRCVNLSFRAEPVFRPDDEALQEQFNRMAGILSGDTAPDTAALMEFAKELSTGYEEYLPELITFTEGICRDALLVKSGVILTEKPMTGYIEKTAGISYEGLERILKAAKSARHDLLLKLTTETVLDSLLLNIKQAITTPVT